ncbi:MAG: glutamate 5-kinase [Oscillospiraceae bacterium]|jgi:glutamate 5-kinase|nr:glutamate 5-kinase [Oscillospiraceae bacterium]
MQKQKIVIKIGTSTLCHLGNGLNYRNIERVCREIADLKHSGCEITLVTSGAIGAGTAKLNLPSRPTGLREKQAVASVGQSVLMHAYDKFFSEYGVTAGQILLNKEDTNRPSSRESLLGTFNAMFALGVLPVVNENDAVGFDEIESDTRVFGDNDTLSAVVAGFTCADLLVILTDIDGLFTANPHEEPDAQLIARVTEVTPRILELAGGAGSAFGTGGMATKVKAAMIAAETGCNTVIVNGAVPGNLYRAAQGLPAGTLFELRSKH